MQLKEEMNKMMEEKNEGNNKNSIFLNHMKEQNNLLTQKIIKYEDATFKQEKHNQTIMQLKEEISKLKEEARQETTLLINSRIRQLTKEEEKNVDIPFSNEYNVFFEN